MAHLLSVGFFVTLILSSGLFLGRMFLGSGWAIRAALVGTWISERIAETPFGRIGSCLRASFPARGDEPLGEDLSDLVKRLSAEQ